MIRAATAVSLLLALSAPAFAAEIVVHDAKSQPESLTVAPDGSVIAGSASSPFIYRVKKGAATSETFVDVSSEGLGTFFLGQLADAATGTLWTCQLTPVPGTTPAARHSSLRGFDLCDCVLNQLAEFAGLGQPGSAQPGATSSRGIALQRAAGD